MFLIYFIIGAGLLMIIAPMVDNIDAARGIGAMVFWPIVLGVLVVKLFVMGIRGLKKDIEEIWKY